MSDFSPADLCGCCATPAGPTPRRVFNRPGLTAIAYRVGSFGSFRAAMLEAIARAPELGGLTTRERDDYAITLLELWAAVGDALTFYQERIANEAFLRTAVHRDSVLRLARLLDYRLRPGLAATTRLAFTLDQGATVKVPVGLKVMSMPGQDELPQFFETVEAIDADARLNALRIFPPTVAAASFAAGSSGAALTAYPVPLAPGDKLVLWSDTTVEEKVVASLTRGDDGVRVTWSPALVAGLSSGRAARYTRMLRFFGCSSPASYQRYQEGVLNESTGTWTTAPRWASVSLTAQLGFAAGMTEYPLDARYDDLQAGSRLLIQTSLGVFQRTVHSLRQAPQVLGALQETVTLVTLDASLGAVGDRRACRIYQLVEPELAFRDYDFPAQISGGRVLVPLGWLDQLDTGRAIMLRDANGGPYLARVTGAVALGTLDADSDPQAFPASPSGFLQIDFSPVLPQPLEAASARLLGNIADATHGETVTDELLGDGDAARPFQAFTLQKSPLTYLRSPRTTRGESTVRLMVGDEQWQETDSLYGQPPRAAVYTLRQTDEGKTRVQFGDGVTGVRLPSGRANLKATYRKGLGLAGRVRADQLSILLSRPVGMKSVSNPLAAEGGADAEPLDQARTNAPSTVRTFGRAIALDDFAWLAAASGEVARTSASWVWRGCEKAIHLTVAAQQGAPLSAAALATLYTGLTAERDPNHVLLLGNVCRVPIVVRAMLTVADGFVRDDVRAAARQAVLDRFAFDRIPFARAVHRSDVYAALQAVRGVMAVDLNVFHYKGYTGWTEMQLAARGATAEPLQTHLRMFAARTLTEQLLATDPLLQHCTAGSALPDVLPAEQACIEDSASDVDLGATGGIA